MTLQDRKPENTKDKQLCKTYFLFLSTMEVISVSKCCILCVHINDMLNVSIGTFL